MQLLLYSREPKNETRCTIMGIKVNLAKSKNLLEKGLVGQSVFFGFFIFLRMADEFLKFLNWLNLGVSKFSNSVIFHQQDIVEGSSKTSLRLILLPMMIRKNQLRKKSEFSKLLIVWIHPVKISLLLLKTVQHHTLVVVSMSCPSSIFVVWLNYDETSLKCTFCEKYSKSPDFSTCMVQCGM